MSNKTFSPVRNSLLRVDRSAQRVRTAFEVHDFFSSKIHFTSITVASTGAFTRNPIEMPIVERSRLPDVVGYDRLAGT